MCPLHLLVSTLCSWPSRPQSHSVRHVTCGASGQARHAWHCQWLRLAVASALVAPLAAAQAELTSRTSDTWRSQQPGGAAWAGGRLAARAGPARARRLGVTRQGKALSLNRQVCHAPLAKGIPEQCWHICSVMAWTRLVTVQGAQHSLVRSLASEPHYISGWCSICADTTHAAYTAQQLTLP